MHVLEEKKIYQDTERYIDTQQHLRDGIQFSLVVEFQSEKFVEYQKDLLQEFVADFVDGITDTEEHDNDAVRAKCETALQELNTKLKAFADKVRDIEYFPIKGYMQIILGTTLISSMIGNATVMILRDRKIYYTLTNSTKVKGKIDLFSEFIEGDLESGDEVIYIGTRITDVLDAYDVKDIEQILQSEEGSIIGFMDEVLTSRIEKENLGFLMGYTIQGMTRKSHMSKKISLDNLTSKFGFIQEWKEKFFKNKYQVTVGILSLFIAFMLYSLVTQLLKKPQGEIYINPQGVTVDLTIDDIKKDIVLFKSMDPTGDEKAMKYQEIVNKITILEKRGRWIEDLQQLQKILKADYYKGFNIITVNNLSQFDDPVLGRKTTLMSFNTSEKSTLGELSKIEYAKDILIAGSKAALLGVVNENSRGSLVSYNIDDTIENCSLNLLRNGFYCYTTNGKIYVIARSGIESVTTADPDGFPMSIGGIGTYGKSNMYVFAKNVTNLADSTLVVRYRNTLGSQSIYQQGQKYMMTPDVATGLNFGSGFSTFTIDVNFLGWSQGKLYQFRRNPATSFNLAYREIKLLGGDTKTMKLSDDVKIVTPSNSRYVYLFDRVNQTFMVYESRPLKTNDQYATSYNLYYLFSFAFDLGNNKVVDVTIPDELGNRPELYVLTQAGINKIQLHEFVDSIKNNNVLKQVN
ncbi:hypothetical protein P148_SR1C00001G0246 [candidate division SR1 bacterium RAAC1_SR1_1]|nr:hypothetical protein P148_SR1C00001G0246 [candidate division SR1 bacterium RAAC1_SR1_1]